MSPSGSADQKHEFTVKGQRFTVTADQVRSAVRRVEPEPIRSGGHYVVVAGRRYPVKQVAALVTGLDRLDFQTNQARDILRGCGFELRRNT